MEFKPGQFVVILSVYTDVELYGNIKYVADDSLTIITKTSGLLKKGWDILCIIIDDTDIFEFYSKVKLLEGNNVIVEKPLSEGLNLIERRRFSRAECEIGFVGRLLLINNISMQKSGKSFIGTIKNISAGGILAETNLCLPKDTVFNFKLKINYFIDCAAKVRRVNEVPNEKKYEMGCEFINLSEEDIKAISMFAFKERLKKRRKELYQSVFK